MMRLAAAAALTLITATTAAQDGDLPRVLSAHPWCSIVEDRATATVRREELRFMPDGTLVATSRSESRKSGAGTSASASSSASRTLRWRVEGRDLAISDNGVNWRRPAFELRPGVIVVDGREHSPC